MTTAFAATLVDGFPVVEGPKRKRAKFYIQMPSSWTGATGEALDLSDADNGAFSVITDYSFGPSTAVVDHGWVYNLKGTATTAKDGITASTVYVTAHSSAGSAATMANSDSDDMSATTTMMLTVWGY